ncbi:MAG: class I SAM-dependent methyltransferase [Cyclonatronaceae bacterium]
MISDQSSALYCPLCKAAENFTPVPGQDDRDYYHCANCELIFIPPAQYLPPDAEKARYEEHNNGIQYPGYVRFLMQAVTPSIPLLQPGNAGLDYGCGPSPTLSILVEREGFRCQNYDPFFRRKLPPGPHDFIFATECFEHFFAPHEELQTLGSLLKPGGLLIIMTLFWQQKTDFLNDYYFRDPAHCVFYHHKTIDFIASEYGYEIEHRSKKRIAILRKNMEPEAG